MEAHDLCSTSAGIARALVARRNMAMDAPFGPLRTWPGPEVRVPAPRLTGRGQDEPGPGTAQRYVEVPLLSAKFSPTYFDCCFACVSKNDGFDVAVAVLRDVGRPGPALHDAAQSGRLEKYLPRFGMDEAEAHSNERAVAYVLGAEIA